MKYYNGGYRVQPVPLTIIQYSMLVRVYTNANGKLRTDILLILGYVTSGDPIFIGSNTLTITIQTLQA